MWPFSLSISDLIRGVPDLAEQDPDAPPVHTPTVDTKRIDDALAWLVDIEGGVEKVRALLLPLRLSVTSDGDMKMADLMQEWLDGTWQAPLGVVAKNHFGPGGSKAAGQWLAKYVSIGPQLPSPDLYNNEGEGKWRELARIALANFATIRSAKAI